MTSKSIARRYDARLSELVASARLPEPIFVTRPTLPSLDAFAEQLQGIWHRAWLTNAGRVHQELEARVGAYLGVEHLSLVSSGTMALELALRSLALRVGEGGEVITTPFTFPATVHAIRLCGFEPVFADIEPRSLNLDPTAVERAITRRTVAVLPVHVFANPAALEAFDAIAEEHGLALLYDAAHAFGVEVEGRSLVRHGEWAALSFHATKLFSTIEGGAVVCSTAEAREKIVQLRNFGYSEQGLAGLGTNGKLSEVHAAFGLLQLGQVEREIEVRSRLAALYREGLADVPGIEIIGPTSARSLRPNHAFMPLRIDAGRFGLDRDQLVDVLKRCNINAREYFSPLVSSCEPYVGRASGRPENLPVATRAAAEVFCLPLYGTLTSDQVQRIAAAVRQIQETVRPTG